MSESDFNALNDALYNKEVFNPSSISVFKGCNNNPEDLSKHLSSVYVLMLSSLIESSLVEIKYSNSVEEIVYDVMDKPSCFSSDMNSYFLKKRIDEISD